VRVRPQPVPGVSWVKAAHQSPRGRVAVAWRSENGVFTLDVEVARNSSAEVWRPSPAAGSVREGGGALDAAVGVRFVRRDGGRDVLAVEAGRYSFSAPLERAASR
jgi:alpha-L-rhamnosidase